MKKENFKKAKEYLNCLAYSNTALERLKEIRKEKSIIINVYIRQRDFEISEDVNNQILDILESAYKYNISRIEEELAKL